MNFLQRMMYGRNGADQLGVFTLLLYLAADLAAIFTRWWPLNLLCTLLAAVLLYRILSRNLPQRRRENAAFLRLLSPLNRWVRTRRMIHTDKAHRYFKCPSCHQHLRVPRGSGKIRVTCRACGVTFETKS